MSSPEAKSARLFKAVASHGRRGWSGGGQLTAVDLTILKALMKPRKNIVSVTIKIIIPNTPLGMLGRFWPEAWFNLGSVMAAVVMAGLAFSLSGLGFGFPRDLTFPVGSLGHGDIGSDGNDKEE